jgi:hypothetical protein
LLLRHLFYQHFAAPVCKILRQLTKPKQTAFENVERGLAKIEKKYQNLPIKQRIQIMVAAIGGTYLLGLAALSFLWYRQQSTSSFHFFDDNPEWQQMDKFGHAYTAFHLSRLVVYALQYAGLDHKTALQYGGWSGAVMMTPIEILDGFSEGYGASWGDEVANFVGAAFFIWQQKQWGEIRLMPKFTFSPSPFAKLRPALLGKNIAEQWLKDYNGQTYWLAIPLPVQISKDKNAMTNLLLGYGAGNMIYGRPEQNRAAGLEPYRKFYVALEMADKPINIEPRFTNKLLSLLELLAFPIIKLRVDTEKLFISQRNV